MACYHPLKGFSLGIKENGKKDICITSYDVDHVEVDRNGTIYKCVDSDFKFGNRIYRDFDLIPCGRCIGCRLQKSKSWADRAFLELQDNDSNLFLTITYDEDHIPTNPATDEVTGEIVEIETLVKKDLQDFWKNLRYECEKKGIRIRYLACGEYGSRTFRPHYHAIVFGLSVDDLKFYKVSELGDMYYTSETLNKIWKKGYVIVGEATWQSIAYVSRYVVKKLYGKESDLYEKLNITPPFLVMSRKPGIGRKYYEEHKEELFKQGRFPVLKGDHVGTAYTSRYFNDLFELDYDSESVERRKQRLKGLYDDRMKLELEKTDLNYLDYLETKEYNHEERANILKLRNSI